MTMRHQVSNLAVVGIAAVAAAMAACSSSDESAAVVDTSTVDSKSGTASDASTGDSGGGTSVATEGPSSGEDTFQACATGAYPIGLMPVDMLLAIDTSYSMDYAPDGAALSKWESVKRAIAKFVELDDGSGLGMAIQYFPLRQQCNVSAYEVPAVPFLELPDVESQIATSLDAQRMAGGTPMVPLMQGALVYARARAAESAGRRTIIILATDGIPDDTCRSTKEGALPNSVENVVALAGEGLEGSPSVPTYVIGVGSELGALNDISRAGNGADAFLVDVEGGNLEESFLSALEEIRKAKVCEYDLAKIAEGRSLDPRKVNVTFTLDGITEEFRNVGDESGCEKAPESGWYYSPQDEPEKLILCSKTCKKIQDHLGGELELVFGCDALVI